MQSKIFTVSQLTYAIKSLLEPSFRGISVQGEISNFKEQSSGHLYFSLKDTESQIAAVLFKGDAKKLARLPRSGDQVMVKGELSIYPPKGNYQIIVRELIFSGEGELLLKLQRLKEELKMRGWLDPQRKKPLPLFPKTIGIVTSPTGAAIQDILHILKRRFSPATILLNPVKVQGEGAAEEIARAIYEMNQYQLADVLIVGRGGGSLEDLWAFNEEIVAKAIFESSIPVVSAVGHEIDLSLSDLVADVRAPTPSAAAELVTKEKEELFHRLSNIQKQTEKQVTQQLYYQRDRIKRLERQPLFSSPYALLGQKMQQMDDWKGAIDLAIHHFLEKKKTLFRGIQRGTAALNPLLRLSHMQQQVKIFFERLDKAWATQFQNRKRFLEKVEAIRYAELCLKHLFLKKERLIRLCSHLKALDPKNLLQKGYSILFSEKEGSLILSIKEVEPDQKIYALVGDGKILAKIEKTYDGKSDPKSAHFL